MRKLILTLLFGSFSIVLMAQNEWIVPDNDLQKISPFIFDEEMVSSGEVIYENSCITCHGTPTHNNPVVFVPSPGDPVFIRIRTSPRISKAGPRPRARR